MGFTAPRRTMRLMFTDPSYAGLEVTTAVAVLGTLDEAAGLAHIDPQAVSSEDMARVDRLITAFAAALKSWNLEDDTGAPIPATEAGVRSLDLPFAMQLIGAWLEAAGEVIAAQAAEDAKIAETLKIDTLG